MSHKVTFNVADDKANVLGCDAVVDEFGNELSTGNLVNVIVEDNRLKYSIDLEALGSVDVYETITATGSYTPAAVLNTVSILLLGAGGGAGDRFG